LLFSATSRGVSWWVNSTASHPPFSDLTGVLLTVRARFGDWGPRGWLSAALAFLIYRRLSAVCGQMERLAARFRAGTLRRVVARSSRVAAVVEDRPVRVKPEVAWPRPFGWMVAKAGWRAAGYGSQLQTVLQTPEMMALLEAAPQAARLLRLGCRMLAVDTRVLKPGTPIGFEPPKPATPAKPRVRQPSVRKPRQKVDWGRIALPRGVLAWAKREGFGKLPRDWRRGAPQTFRLCTQMVIFVTACGSARPVPGSVP
jgi:hypothetical protein